MKCRRSSITRKSTMWASSAKGRCKGHSQMSSTTATTITRVTIRLACMTILDTDMKYSSSWVKGHSARLSDALIIRDKKWLHLKLLKIKRNTTIKQEWS